MNVTAAIMSTKDIYVMKVYIYKGIIHIYFSVSSKFNDHHCYKVNMTFAVTGRFIFSVQGSDVNRCQILTPKVDSCTKRVN